MRTTCSRATLLATFVEMKVRLASRLLLMCCVFMATGWGMAWGQTDSPTGLDAVYGEGVDLVLTDASQFFVELHSQGAGIGFRRGKYQGATTIKGWQSDLVFVRHPKEEKIQNISHPDALPYVLGKINAHHALRLKRYAQSVWTEKFRLSGVAVSSIREWGVVLGIDKPVFLEIGYGELPYDYWLVERYNPEEHATNNIRGRAPWVNGLEELSMNPGLTLGQMLSFEFGQDRTTTRTIEAGIQLDVYLAPVEIMAPEYVDPNRVHVLFNLRYAWGAQWSAKGLKEALD